MKDARAGADCVNEMAKRSACAAAKIKTAPEHVSVICGSEKGTAPEYVFVICSSKKRNSAGVRFRHLLQRKMERHQSMFPSFAAAKNGTAPEYVFIICHNENLYSNKEWL